jgi:hypothetical protein
MLDLDKFFTNLSPTKLFIVGIVTTATFWYLDIFIFKKTLITNEQVQISIVLSLCLGFMTSVVGSFIGLITQLIDEIKNDKKEIVADEENEKNKLQHNIFLFNFLFTPCILAFHTFFQIAVIYYYPNTHLPTLTQYIVQTFYILFGAIICIVVKPIILVLRKNSNKSSSLKKQKTS